MANHSTPMHLIRRLIQLRLQGYSNRSIARHLSLARKTVDKYVQELESHFPDLSALAQWPDENLYHFLLPQPGKTSICPVLCYIRSYMLPLPILIASSLK